MHAKCEGTVSQNMKAIAMLKLTDRNKIIMSLMPLILDILEKINSLKKMNLS